MSAGPYRVHGALSYDLEPDRLHLRLVATNEGDAPVPVGIGIHPWFTHGRVRVPAEARWPGEPIPTGPPVAVGERYDLRHGAVPDPMDACFTSLTGPDAEAPGVRLRWDGPVTNVVVYSREPGWVCVEPVTMPTNGFDLGPQDRADHEVQILQRGASIEVRYHFEQDLVPNAS